MENKSRSITVDGGRRIQIEEAGRPDGAPIFALFGTPGSRRIYRALAEDADARAALA